MIYSAIVSTSPIRIDYHFVSVQQRPCYQTFNITSVVWLIFINKGDKLFRLFFGKHHVLTVPVVFLSPLFIRNVIPDWLKEVILYSSA